MKKNKKKYWQNIRILLYAIGTFLGIYLMISQGDDQHVTNMSFFGVIVFTLSLCLLFWQIIRAYFVTKKLQKSVKELQNIIERTAKKTEAASKETKELIAMVKKNNEV